VFNKMQADQAAIQHNLQRQLDDEVRQLEEIRSSDATFKQEEDGAMQQVQTVDFRVQSARNTIAQMQALLRSDEEILAQEQRKLADVQNKRKQLYNDLNVHSSELERIKLQLAAGPLESEDVMRARALAAVEKTREEEIEKAKHFITELARLR